MKTITSALCAFLALSLVSSTFAAKKRVLDAKIDEAIEEFYEHTSAGKKLAKDAEAMLVFPSVGKAGIGIGGEYGEGALIIDGKKVEYYSTASASIGFQLGVQSRRQILLFLDKAALNAFRNSEGWEVGVDGSVAIANIGAGGEIDTKTINEPVVAFVFGNKGLMYNLSLEGSKLTKIKK
ncbi:YSC84-related protein [Pelagicoccus sp. SDUM812003]|uniref:BPSL1445 family SYLF domain-containing lipoprotein n=1 Tax=Pelagicoccus sp. SDUM812003 TaxID=3041267 RepID=UPI00280CA75A|nr:YSC84-related protein [Pelagicoccus sp. SDUM812003]MDQ8201843.1 YSC84-related protein [Pelagicoccus sp. SDUM812003]